MKLDAAAAAALVEANETFSLPKPVHLRAEKRTVFLIYQRGGSPLGPYELRHAAIRQRSSLVAHLAWTSIMTSHGWSIPDAVSQRMLEAALRGLGAARNRLIGLLTSCGPWMDDKRAMANGLVPRRVPPLSPVVSTTTGGREVPINGRFVAEEGTNVGEPSAPL